MFPWSFRQWPVFFFNINEFFVASAVTPDRADTGGVVNPQCLSVLAKVTNIWVFVPAAFLPLASTKLLKEVLRVSLTEEGSDTRDGEDELHQIHKEIH